MGTIGVSFSFLPLVLFAVVPLRTEIYNSLLNLGWLVLLVGQGVSSNISVSVGRLHWLCIPHLNLKKILFVAVFISCAIISRNVTSLQSLLEIL